MSPFKLHLFGSARTETSSAVAGTANQPETSTVTATPNVAEAEPLHAPSPRLPNGKLGLIFSRIAATPGVTIDELTEETGWQAHTIRAAISRLRLTGRTILLVAGSDGAKTYRLADGEG